MCVCVCACVGNDLLDLVFGCWLPDLGLGMAVQDLVLPETVGTFIHQSVHHLCVRERRASESRHARQERLLSHHIHWFLL